MADDDATREAPAGGPLPTTDLGPALRQDEPQHAYSAEDLDLADILPGSRTSWWRPAGISAAILASAAVLAGIIYFVGQPGQPAAPIAVAPQTVTMIPPPPPTTSTPPSPPAPPTVTVTAEPPAPTATPESLPPDAQFIQMLGRDGVGHGEPHNAIATAKNLCQSMANGWTADDVALSMNGAGMSYREAVAFVRAARTVYCPGVG